MSIQQQAGKITWLHKFIIHPQHAKVSASSQSQKAIRVSEGHKSPSIAALTSFVFALTISYSGLVVEGWVCSHGLLDQGKLPERKGKQGQVACRRGQELSIIPLAQRWNPWPQLWPDTSEGGRKRGQAFSTSAFTSASSSYTGVERPSPS